MNKILSSIRSFIVLIILLISKLISPKNAPDWWHDLVNESYFVPSDERLDWAKTAFSCAIQLRYSKRKKQLVIFSCKTTHSESSFPLLSRYNFYKASFSNHDLSVYYTRNTAKTYFYVQGTMHRAPILASTLMN